MNRLTFFVFAAFVAFAGCGPVTHATHGVAADHVAPAPTGHPVDQPDAGEKSLTPSYTFWLWDYSDNPTGRDQTPGQMHLGSFSLYSNAPEGTITAVRGRFERYGAGPVSSKMTMAIVSHDVGTSPALRYFGLGEILTDGQETTLVLTTSRECKAPRTGCEVVPLGNDPTTSRYLMFLGNMAQAGIGAGQFVLTDVQVSVDGGEYWVAKDGLRLAKESNRLPLRGRQIR